MTSHLVTAAAAIDALNEARHLLREILDAQSLGDPLHTALVAAVDDLRHVERRLVTLAEDLDPGPVSPQPPTVREGHRPRDSGRTT